MLELIREAAYLSLRGFNTTGIQSAEVVSPTSQTHRGRRLRAKSEASSDQHPAQVLDPHSPQHSIQQPKLKTVSSLRNTIADPVWKLSKVQLRRQRSAERPKRCLPSQGPTWLEDAPTDLPMGNIDSLRRDLGLLGDDFEVGDAVYIAIDTEGSHFVREIGVSTLDTRDIRDITPGYRAANWIAKVKHQHFGLLESRFSPLGDYGRAFFCNTQHVAAANVRALLLATLQFARQPSADHAPRKVHLVGQSIAGDLSVLRRAANMQVDLSGGPGSDFGFDRVYDTYDMSLAAEQMGASFLSHRLGHLARRLEVDSTYWHGETVRGIHNASNDAAYTMMVLLLFAVRWPHLSEELKDPLPMSWWRQKPAVSHRLIRQSRKKPKLSSQEVPDRRDRNEGLIRDVNEVSRPGLLDKLRTAIQGLLWRWR